MKSVRIYQFGGPEVLQLEEVAVPQPGAEEVLVRVEAAGVNFADTMRQRGNYVEPTPLPYAPGSEIAGVVESVGEDVAGVAPGTRVMAFLPGGGGYSQYAVVPHSQLIPLPDRVDTLAAPSLLIQGLTAYLLLKKASRFEPGETVLVHAAAGGVGSLLVQLAKILGAGRVIATASTSKKLQQVALLGADAGVNYTESDWPARVLAANNGRGVDVVLEMVGGEIFSGSLECLAPRGRVIVYGNAGGKAVTFDPQKLVTPSQTITGFYLGQYFEYAGEALAALFGYVASGKLKLEVGQVFGLNQVAEAHTQLENRQTSGKIIIQPWNIN